MTNDFVGLIATLALFSGVVAAFAFALSERAQRIEAQKNLADMGQHGLVVLRHNERVLQFANEQSVKRCQVENQLAQVEELLRLEREKHAPLHRAPNGQFLPKNKT